MEHVPEHHEASCDEKTPKAQIAQDSNPKPSEQTKPTEHRKNTWVEKLAIFIAALAFGASAWQGYVERDTEKRELRAYIAVEQIGYQGLSDNGPIGVGFTFTDKGQTPASNFNMVGIIDLLPYPLPNGYILPNPPPRAKQDGIIFPNETNPMVGWVWERSAMAKAAKTELLNPNTSQEIYAHGTITYVDIFGASRYENFCFFLNPASVTYDKSGNLSFQWAPCEGNNKMS